MVWEMDEDTKTPGNLLIWIFCFPLYSFSYPFFGSKWWANIQQLNVFKLSTASIKKNLTKLEDNRATSTIIP